VTLLLDAGALMVQVDPTAPLHARVVDILRGERGPLILSAFAAAEADYMITSRYGIDVEMSFVRDLATEVFQVECLTTAELRRLEDILGSYRDLEIGIADASIVILAQRFRTTRVLTLDERHFRALTPLQGGHFTILPADA
jgi:predicted nucleic acid-binding protein